jgi:uncharacterized protein (DUF608 family)
MANLTKAEIAAKIAKEAASAVTEYRRKQALEYDPAADTTAPGLTRYPEFHPLVQEITHMVIEKINAEANKIESKMPYKAQFTLEEVIRELSDRV